MYVESLGNSPVWVAMGESTGWLRVWLVVWVEERICILVLLPPSEGEAAGLWLPLNTGDWKDRTAGGGGGEDKGIWLQDITTQSDRLIEVPLDWYFTCRLKFHRDYTLKQNKERNPYLSARWLRSWSKVLSVIHWAALDRGQRWFRDRHRQYWRWASWLLRSQCLCVYTGLWCQ